MRARLDAALRTCCTALLAVAMLYGICRSVWYARTAVEEVASPDGRYSVLLHWTDVGAWGWTGKIYLKENWPGGRRYWTQTRMPAAVQWTSATTFRISGQTAQRDYRVADPPQGLDCEGWQTPAPLQTPARIVPDDWNAPYAGAEAARMSGPAHDT